MRFKVERPNIRKDTEAGRNIPCVENSKHLNITRMCQVDAKDKGKAGAIKSSMTFHNIPRDFLSLEGFPKAQKQSIVVTPHFLTPLYTHHNL